MALESELRTVLRDETKFPSGAITFTEFAMGGDAGAPDCWFACAGHWHPLELKRGPNPLNKLRPSQRRWHKDSLRLGIRSFLATIHRGVVSIFELYIDRGDLNCRLIGESGVDDVDLQVLVACHSNDQNK